MSMNCYRENTVSEMDVSSDMQLDIARCTIECVSRKRSLDVEYKESVSNEEPSIKLRKLNSIQLVPADQFSSSNVNICAFQDQLRYISDDKYLLILYYVRMKQKFLASIRSGYSRYKLFHPVTKNSYSVLEKISAGLSSILSTNTFLQNIANVKDDVFALIVSHVNAEQIRRRQGMFNRISSDVIIHILSYIDNENSTLETLRTLTGLSDDIEFYYRQRKILRLDDITLSQKFLKYLSFHPNITELHLTSCISQQLILRSKHNLPTVQHLVIDSKFPYKKFDIFSMMKIESLRILSTCDNIVCSDFTDDSSMDDDESLDDGETIDRGLLKKIALNQNILHLTIEHNIDVEVVRFIGPLVNLRSLKIKHLVCSYSAKPEYFSFLQNMIHLETLIVEEESETYDSDSTAFKYILQNVRNGIKTLHLIHGYDEYDEHHLEILSSLSTIEDLYISPGLLHDSFYRRTESMSSNLFSKLTNLRSLVISDSSEYYMDSQNDLGVNKTDFIRNNKVLRKLNLISCYVTRNGLENIIKCPNLEELVLSYSSEYYEEDIQTNEIIQLSVDDVTSLLISANWNRNIKITIYKSEKDFFDIDILRQVYPNITIR